MQFEYGDTVAIDAVIREIEAAMAQSGNVGRKLRRLLARLVPLQFYGACENGFDAAAIAYHVEKELGEKASIKMGKGLFFAEDARNPRAFCIAIHTAPPASESVKDLKEALDDVHFRLYRAKKIMGESSTAFTMDCLLVMPTRDEQVREIEQFHQLLSGGKPSGFVTPLMRHLVNLARIADPDENATEEVALAA
jgi:hypothetical protein